MRTRLLIFMWNLIGFSLSGLTVITALVWVPLWIVFGCRGPLAWVDWAVERSNEADVGNKP